MTVPRHARQSHARLADHRRGQAARLLDGFDAGRTPSADVQASIALTVAVLALEARVADVADAITAAAGLHIEDEEVAA